MKKNIVLLLMSLSFLMTTDVKGQNYCYDDCIFMNDKNFYATFSSGVNFLQNTTLNGNRTNYKTGYLISGSLGYCCDYGLCLEAEYTYRRNSIKKIDFFVEGSSNHGHYQASSWMANFLWDLPLASWGCNFYNIEPVIGVGVGYDLLQMHAKNSRVVFDQKWHHFSWQIIAGLSYPVFCNTEITLEYVFHQGGCHFYNHSLLIGFLYKFGLCW